MSQTKAPVGTASASQVSSPRRKRVQTELPRIPLHAIIFFPIDYDDPDNGSIKEPGIAAEALSTGPHEEMIREPVLFQPNLTEGQVPIYFREADFKHLENVLYSEQYDQIRKQKLTDGYVGRRIQGESEDETRGKRKGKKESKESDSDKVEVKFLHQMAVFMEMLRHRGFNVDYASNLQTALRTARALNNEIKPETPTESNPKTPKSATSSVPSPLTPAHLRKVIPEEKIMVLTYRTGGIRVHMDTRAYDSLRHENVLLYPPYGHAAWDYAKIYDLKAFDEIARTRPNQWRPQWHYCIPSEGDSECPIPRDRWEKQSQVLKRSHSACTYHVRLFSWQQAGRQPVCGRGLRDYRAELERRDDAAFQRNEIERTQRNQIERAFPMLPETEAKMRENYILHRADFYNYIHQEFVPSLHHWGEIRVFIATRYKKGKYSMDENGKPKREPYVVDIIKTRFRKLDEEKKWETTLADYKEKLNTARGANSADNVDDVGGDNLDIDGDNNGSDAAADDNDANEEIVRCTYSTKNMSVSRLNPLSTKGFNKYPNVTYARLEKFALSQYRRLYRKYHENFSSLEVGGRFDIGVAPNGEDFFINEVTRWWFASWFGCYEDIDKQHIIPAAYARSFSEVFSKLPTGGDGPGNNDGDNGYDSDGQKRNPNADDDNNNRGDKNNAKRPAVSHDDYNDHSNCPPRKKLKKSENQDSRSLAVSADNDGSSNKQPMEKAPGGDQLKKSPAPKKQSKQKRPARTKPTKTPSAKAGPTASQPAVPQPAGPQPRRSARIAKRKSIDS